MRNKHAYLIVCDKNKEQILLLLRMLDHERNDIFLFIDKKSTLKIDDFKNCTKASKIKIYKNIKIFWGSYSLTKVELFLLQQATQSYHDYYHLLSGQCLPIKPINQIFSFFDNRPNYEYIEIYGLDDKNSQRYRKYHFFIKTIGAYWRDDKNSLMYFVRRCLNRIDKIVLKIQNALNINRHEEIRMYKGGQWFSITHNLASFLVNKKKQIKNVYRFTANADESFIQTFAMMSPYANNIHNDHMRLIDWSEKKSHPRTYLAPDYRWIISSNKLFARKFDETIDPRIIKLIYDGVRKNKL